MPATLLTEDTTPSRWLAGMSWMVVAFAALASMAGLATDVYRDVAWVEMTWLGNDIVTLALGAPALAASIVFARRGSVRGELAWCSMLAYMLYNYGYYVLGAHMNRLFPVYIALVVLSAYTLAIALGRMDVRASAAMVKRPLPVRLIAGYMAFTGIGLTFAWLAQWAAYAFGGTEPSIGVEPFSVVATLDLTFVVPAMLLGAVLLWRRNAWGFVIAAVMNVKGALYTLVLTVNSVIGAVRELEGAAPQIPVWGVWTLVGAIVAIALYRAIEPGATGATRPEQAPSE